MRNSKSTWEMELKDMLILASNILKFMYNFPIITILHEHFENSIVWIDF